MAAPTQIGPLRRWKRFIRAFECVDAAIKPSDPDHSRDELRRARGDIVEQLCDAADDDQAERLCGVLDDHMAESLETLRLIPVMPNMLASTDLAKSVCALRRHESERVRVLARGIVSGWRASMQDDLAKVRDALHKLENISMPQTKEITVDQQQHTFTGSDSDIAKTKALVKKTVAVREEASDSAAGDRAGLCSPEKMEAAKRKLRQSYQEAEDAKRRRRTQLVQAPKMTQPASHRQPIRRCTSSMVKKTFSIRTQLP
ncbi:Tyrosine-sulfated glycopeptide receptor 1 [Hordeum vulgare]|uniref:TFIIS N-terminal domain-containing protein n=1 Tax=Hordeum vulgare subsp. vulgare TaxID=112509 RepID=A0A8I6YMM8_HORVV|nr:Tyrosine-sulfated glycopeptide receptor 1 [Hordeum vulgare]KAI4975215.1 hypothetical protein ZWY2020_048822 [Hordeum vulgare]